MAKILNIGFIAFYMLASCGEKKEEPKKNSGPTVVDVIVAQTKTINHIIVANGTVVANDYAELHPEISGKITYLNVPEGKLVNEGTVIAKIYDGDLQAQLEKSKVQLELAEITEKRNKKLLDINGINQSDYDISANQVKSIKADMLYTQSLLSKTIIKAPFTGVVGLRQVSLGGYTTPVTVIATIQEVSKLKVDFTIPEEYSNIIKIGNPVEVTAEVAKDKKIKATIIATEPQIISSSRNLKVRAVINGEKLNPGTFVKVSVISGAESKAIMVPTNAIIPDDKNNQLIVVKGGKANFVNVKTGLRETNNIEITKGLNVGDSVVVTGVLFARPKSPVKVRSVKTLEQLAKINNNTDIE
jgi:membrane fusion protein (multidrug efflux system)